MSAKLKTKYYNSGKKSRIDLTRYYTDNEILNSKLNVLKEDLLNGFSLFNRRYFDRFVNAVDVEDFAEQLALIHEYKLNNNAFSNTEEQYILLYGKLIGSQRWSDKINRVKGENNPWYNHGGKLSPFKQGSVNYSEEALRKAVENRSYNTRLSYYQDKGYTDDEAELLLKDRQSTFSLKKCIEKYGEEDGVKRWKERQEKWQNTLKSKSQEEIDDINKRKSSGIGAYLDRSIPGKLYYIHFFSNILDIEFWKIGITSKRINERFNFDSLKHGHQLYHEILFLNSYDTIQQAYDEEQFILSKFNKHRIIIDIDNFYTTEAFDVDVLHGFYDEPI